MFTLSDISREHAKVKTGADFPIYARTLTEMWVIAYDTYVSDGHAVYLWNDEPLISPPKYEPIEVAENTNKDIFIERLRIHQNGGSDYMTFCRDCAENGVEKWTLDLEAGSCTYFDIKWNTLVVEHFPI